MEQLPKGVRFADFLGHNQVFVAKDGKNGKIMYFACGIDASWNGVMKLVEEKEIVQGKKYRLDELEEMGLKEVKSRGDLEKHYGIGPLRVHLSRTRFFDKRWRVEMVYMAPREVEEILEQYKLDTNGSYTEKELEEKGFKLRDKYWGYRVFRNEEIEVKIDGDSRIVGVYYTRPKLKIWDRNSS